MRIIWFDKALMIDPRYILSLNGKGNPIIFIVFRGSIKMFELI